MGLGWYWPKSTDFKTVTFAQIIPIVEQLNNSPRMTLEFESAFMKNLQNKFKSHSKKNNLTLVNLIKVKN